MVTGIQIIGALFGLIQIYFTFLHYKREEFTLKEFMGWGAIWLGFIVATLFPFSFTVFAGDLGAIRTFDLFAVLGFIVVLSISFYTYVNLDRLRKKMEKTIRDLALQDISDTHSSKKNNG